MAGMIVGGVEVEGVRNEEVGLGLRLVRVVGL